jgi:membrane fusion protein, multidrug efflux system
VVDEGGVVAYREVTLGPVVEGLRVVQTGLAAGDRIVLNGLQRVRPGARVTANVVAMEASDRPLASPASAASAQ